MTTLLSELVVEAPRERCFDLMRSVDAHLVSATKIQATAIGGRVSGLAASGDHTTWSAVFFGCRFRLETRITEYSRPDFFFDEQAAGAFKCFGHHYAFLSLGHARTLMSDRFFFESPLPPLGTLFDFCLKPMMAKALAARGNSIKRIAESEDWKEYLQ